MGFKDIHPHPRPPVSKHDKLAELWANQAAQAPTQQQQESGVSDADRRPGAPLRQPPQTEIGRDGARPFKEQSPELLNTAELEDTGYDAGIPVVDPEFMALKSPAAPGETATMWSTEHGYDEREMPVGAGIAPSHPHGHGHGPGLGHANYWS